MYALFYVCGICHICLISLTFCTENKYLGQACVNRSVHPKLSWPKYEMVSVNVYNLQQQFIQWVKYNAENSVFYALTVCK